MDSTKNFEEFYLEMVGINKTHEDNSSHRFPDFHFVCSAKNCGAIFNQSCNRNTHEKRCHTESNIVPKTEEISQKVHRISSGKPRNFPELEEEENKKAIHKLRMEQQKERREFRKRNFESSDLLQGYSKEGKEVNREREWLSFMSEKQNQKEIKKMIKEAEKKLSKRNTSQKDK